MSTIESSPHVPAQDIPLAGRAAIERMAAYHALVAEAAQDHEAFWARLAREHLSWRRPFTQVLDDKNATFYKWFQPGQLHTSIPCLARILHTRTPYSPPLIFPS